jgi:uncharacterized membrane protein
LFLGAIPDLAINLLSAKPEQTAIYWHYTAGIVPFVVAASIVGAARLKRNPDTTTLAVLALIGCFALLSPIYRIAVTDLAHFEQSDPRHAAKSHALALIPSEVPVSASNQLGGLLSERRYVYLFPTKKQASWVVVDSRDPTYSQQRSYRRSIAAIHSDPAWRVVYRSLGIQVFKKRTTS